MVLKEYAKYINELAKKNPKARVIYASDEEGNSYNDVFYQPSIQKDPTNDTGDIVCIIN